MTKPSPPPPPGNGEFTKDANQQRAEERSANIQRKRKLALVRPDEQTPTPPEPDTSPPPRESEERKPRVAPEHKCEIDHASGVLLSYPPEYTSARGAKVLLGLQPRHLDSIAEYYRLEFRWNTHSESVEARHTPLCDEDGNELVDDDGEPICAQLDFGNASARWAIPDEAFMQCVIDRIQRDYDVVTWLKTEKDFKFKAAEVSHIALERWITALAQHHKVNPFADYLWECHAKWKTADKEAIAKCTDYYQVAFRMPVDEYTQAVSRHFFLSVVWRVLDGSKGREVPLREYCADIGKGRIGKTLARREMIPPYLRAQGYFSESFDFDTPQKMCEATGGAALAELPEIPAPQRGNSNADVRVIKGWLTKTTDTYRAPYEHKAHRRLRKCVLVGTGNDVQYLAGDEAYRDRWLTVRVYQCRNTGGEQMANDMIADIGEALPFMYGHAVALYLDGVKPIFPERLKPMQEAAGRESIAINEDAMRVVNHIVSWAGKQLQDGVKLEATALTVIGKESGVRVKSSDKSTAKFVWIDGVRTGSVMNALLSSGAYRNPVVGEEPTHGKSKELNNMPLIYPVPERILELYGTDDTPDILADDHNF